MTSNYGSTTPRKILHFRPSSQDGKRDGPIKWSPIIPTYTFTERRDPTPCELSRLLAWILSGLKIFSREKRASSMNRMEHCIGSSTSTQILHIEDNPPAISAFANPCISAYAIHYGKSQIVVHDISIT